MWSFFHLDIKKPCWLSTFHVAESSLSLAGVGMPKQKWPISHSTSSCASRHAIPLFQRGVMLSPTLHTPTTTNVCVYTQPLHWHKGATMILAAMTRTCLCCPVRVQLWRGECAKPYMIRATYRISSIAHYIQVESLVSSKLMGLVGGSN